MPSLTAGRPAAQYFRWRDQAAGGFSRWMRNRETGNTRCMKSCLGLLFILLVFTVVFGGGALIWYLSNTAEFTKQEAPPKAIPAGIH